MTTPRTRLSRRLAAGLAATTLTLTGCTATGHNSDAIVDQVSDIKRVSVHDPSVVKAGDTYYVFGSHRAWAKSTDLVNWETFSNNLSTDFNDILGDIWQAWPKQPANSDLTGNMWAPEVVWNETMGKWCMYMSVNGINYKSVIVLLTADDIEGDWTYVGPVVYSGFRTDTMAATDVTQVLGSDTTPSRYLSPGDTEINAIDPCVTYDEDGSMWMSFGSWFGGLWMIKLDPTTGLRDYSTTYNQVEDRSDPYYGVKIAGGHAVSGEGSYLLNTNGYWYLFVSYAALQQTGGYQVRLFRSKNITGPYLDEAGNSAIFTSSITENWLGDTGIRLMSSVQWSGNDSDAIEVAQGHNSAMVDDDGTAYIVYHTRFSSRGEEHEVRVRELLPTADGWLTAAPYEYTGVNASTTGYAANELSGDYELVVHNTATFFQGLQATAKTDGDDTDTQYKGVELPVSITLHANGTVSGERTGTWSVSEGTNQMTLTLASDDGETTYVGAFADLPRDKDLKQVMAFSAIGGNRSIWASKV